MAHKMQWLKPVKFPHVGKHIIKIRNGPGEQVICSLKLWEFWAEILRGTERRPRPIIWYHSQPWIPKSNHDGQPFSYFFHICVVKKIQNTTWKLNFSGIPWIPRPTEPSLDERAEKILQDARIESSVRPNGTPVMPVLRSWSTVKKKFVKTTANKTWSGN